MRSRTPTFPAAAAIAAAFCVGAAGAASPKFLELGRSYSISTIAGSRVAKVIEIDKDAGWVKVQIEKPRPETLWVNLAQVLAINETLPPEDKPLPPVSFGKPKSQ